MKKSRALWVFALMSMLPAAGRAEAQAADPYRALAFFEGKWTIKGSESTYRETCEWFQNRRFLICRAEDSEGGSADWTMSIFGYSRDKQAYTHTAFPSSGAQRTIQGWVDGQTWTFTGESQAANETHRSHVTITPTENGFVFRREVSTNGRPWERKQEYTYVRVSR